MKKAHKLMDDSDAIRAEYDFSGAVRGKYAGSVLADAKVIVLDPDVAAAYPDSKSVNRALRAALKARRIAARSKRRPT